MSLDHSTLLGSGTTSTHYKEQIHKPCPAVERVGALYSSGECVFTTAKRVGVLQGFAGSVYTTGGHIGGLQRFVASALTTTKRVGGL